MESFLAAFTAKSSLSGLACDKAKLLLVSGKPNMQVSPSCG